MPTATNFERERQELAALLASGIFSRAPSLAQLLTYICQKHFDGESSQIKEYNIAVEALGRSPDFDQKRDSIVRVEAHRLRKRLKDYYEGAGADHGIQIMIPPGQYAPKFLAKAPPDAILVTGETALVASGESRLATLPAQQAIETVERPPHQFSPVLRRAEPKLWILFAAALAVLAIAGGTVVIARVLKNPHEPVLKRVIPVDPLVPAGQEIRILAGASKPYTDRFGRLWEADRYFTGGTTASSLNHPIWGTRDSPLYQYRREGAFRYDLPVKPGVYELRLHFAETIYGESNIAGGGETSRLFDVRVNGARILEGIDVVADAGPSTADIRVFKDIQPGTDGIVHLEFEPEVNVPFVNSIELTPGTPGKLRPIRILARDQPYTDKIGRRWEADQFYRGGQTVVRPISVTGAADPEIYRGERFGNLTYGIPVARGRYAVVLHFAETWFGSEKPQRGGAGSRLFDILCNGVALARSFDIYKEAGGGDRALPKVFHGLEPSPQGKLVLSLVPLRNYACINAIEVLDESVN